MQIVEFKEAGGTNQHVMGDGFPGVPLGICTVFVCAWMAQVVDGEWAGVHGEDGAETHEVDVEMERLCWIADTEH